MDSSSDKELREDFHRLWSQAMSQEAAKVLEGINTSLDALPSNSREARTLETMRSTLLSIILPNIESSQCKRERRGPV